MFIASSSDGKVKVWDPKDPIQLRCDPERSSWFLQQIGLPSKDETSSIRRKRWVHFVQAFDLDHKVNTEAGGIFSMCLFGVNYVVTGHSCGTVKIWDASSSWLCNKTITSAHPNSSPPVLNTEASWTKA